MSLSRIPEQHRKAARIAIAASAACGPVGAFNSVADIASIAGIWGTCLCSIASKEGWGLDKETAIDVCKSALLGMSAYYVGCKTATRFFLLIPGAGLFAAMGISALTNVVFTYRFVLTVSGVFAENGSLRLETLSENIKAMFKGNGALNDVKDITDIMLFA